MNIIGKHCDGLEVSVSGHPRMPVFEWLKDERRALRQSAQRLRDVGPVPGVPGGPLMLTRKGSGGYHFVLWSAAIKRLELSGWRRSSQVMVQFRAKTLHEHDLTEVATIVDSIASYFLEGSFEVLVRRGDLALDVQFPNGEMPERQDIITRPKGRVFDEGPDRVTGMRFGSDKGPMQVVIYNKTRDIKVRGGGWIEADWATRAVVKMSGPVVSRSRNVFEVATSIVGADCVERLCGGLEERLERPRLRLPQESSFTLEKGRRLLL